MCQSADVYIKASTIVKKDKQPIILLAIERVVPKIMKNILC